MRRGKLRVLLGAAPGVGKTYTMLEEGRRLRDEGHDVVAAFIETHGRATTAAMIGDLEVITRRTETHRGMPLEEMDVDAVLARKPEVALVDELAHTNAPGSRHPKRWQDVEDLLAAGIDVLSTVNTQHIESLGDVVLQITGVPQRETIPDSVLRSADQIEVIDLAPQALRDRLASGLVYPAERIDAALSNYFRLGNLTALRELALLWLADEVVESRIQARDLGYLGEPTVNVLQLNLAPGRPRTRPSEQATMKRGRLRVFLGAAPRRRQDLRDARGGSAPARRRPRRRRRPSSRPTAGRRPQRMIGGLEVVPRRTDDAPRRAPSTEMDVDAVLARQARDRPRRRARAHRTRPARGIRSAGRTSRTCSPRASTCSRR